jgi:predicted transposase YbfD/YdcC
MTKRTRSSIENLKDHFAELPDPRSSINRQHLLVDVIVICVCGVLAGADGPAAIAEWAQLHREWLEEFLELPEGIPSRDTYRRVLQRLQPQAFQTCFAEWLKSLTGPSGAEFLAIDGKTLRRSHDRKQNLGPLHMVSVWATEQRLTLGQVATAEKSNEITAIPLVLELVDVQGAVVTIDAMGCQKEIARDIVTRGGDYVLPVKGNHTKLEESIHQFLSDHLEDDFKRIKVSRHTTQERSHGREESRSYFQIDVPESLSGRKEWAGLRTLGMVIRTRETGGKETGEVQYYVSSLKRNAKYFARAVRAHWGIENTCHWSLDMTFREDESRTRDRHVAENLSWLRRFALGLIKQHPNQKMSQVMKRRACGWSTDFLTEVLIGAKG